MIETLDKLDSSRVTNSFLIRSESKKRFDKKQRRGKRVHKQISKHGSGYHSKMYSGVSKKTFPAPVSDSEENVVVPIIDVLPVVESSKVAETEDY